MAFESISMFSERRFASLLKASVLADIAPDSVPVLYSLMECGAAQPGDCIRANDDLNATLFIVASGGVQLFDPAQHRQLARLHLGDSFGMLSMLFPGIACPDAYAIEPTQCVMLHCEALRMLELSDPKLAIAISRCIRSHLTPLMSVVSNVVMRHCL